MKKCLFIKTSNDCIHILFCKTFFYLHHNSPYDCFGIFHVASDLIPKENILCKYLEKHHISDKNSGYKIYCF